MIGWFDYAVTSTGWTVRWYHPSGASKLFKIGVPFSVRHGRAFSQEELHCQAFDAVIGECDRRTQHDCWRASDEMKLTRIAA